MDENFIDNYNSFLDQAKVLGYEDEFVESLRLEGDDANTNANLHRRIEALSMAVQQCGPLITDVMDQLSRLRLAATLQNQVLARVLEREGRMIDVLKKHFGDEFPEEAAPPAGAFNPLGDNLDDFFKQMEGQFKA